MKRCATLANGSRTCSPSPNTHELRNEVVEELIPHLMSESCTERTAPCVGGNRTRGMESKKGRRREESRKSQEKRPEGFHSEKQACPKRETQRQPRARVKPLPNRVRWQSVLG